MDDGSNRPMGPYASMAHHYFEAGWAPLPVNGKGPPPAGFTGADGRYPSKEDVARWMVERGDQNLALRLPPDGLGLDLDAYKEGADETFAGLLHVLENHQTELPETLVSTARNDHWSGIRLYRVRPGLPWRDIGPGLELIHPRHRYVVTWPSIHPELGTPYRLHSGGEKVGPEVAQGVYRPDQLAYLPDRAQDVLLELGRGSRRTERTREPGDGVAWTDPESGRKVDQEAILAGELDGYPNQRDALIGLTASAWAHGVPAAAIKHMGYTAIEHFPQTKPDPWTEEDVDKLVDDWTSRHEPGRTHRTLDVSFEALEWAQARAQAVTIGGESEEGSGAATAIPEVIKTRLVSAGDFALDEPEQVPAVWGTGEKVLWAEGEGTMVAGHQGVGKTTIGHQLVLFRVGILKGEFLGLPVAPTTGKVIVLAMDRPRQAARSLRRMLTEKDREVLNGRVVVWRGPLPFNPLAKPSLLADFIQGVCPECTDAVVDSVKDLAPGIAKDEVGSALNQAWQEVIARGIELLLLHHERKAAQDGKRHHALDDVYGSTWLTSGLGSVIALDGDPGDPTVELVHLKQPAAPVGPLTVRHDHAAGKSTLLTESVDLLDLLVAAGDVGVTAAYAAEKVFGRATDVDQQKIRRRLNKLVDDKLAFKVEGTRTGKGATPDRWFATDEALWALELRNKL